MPTQIQITKYCCNVCGYPYEQYNTAILCESAPIIPEPQVINIGLDIMFEEENVSVSSRRLPVFLSPGIVLAKMYMTVKNEAGFFEHHHAYVVKCFDADGGRYERVVMWVSDGFAENGKKLYSPSRFKYEDGYHKNIPKNLKLIDHINNHNNVNA